MSHFSLSPGNIIRSSRLLSIGLIAMLAIALVPLVPPQPASAASGLITIENYICPDGYDAESAVFGDLDTNCTTPAVGETFSLVPDGGAASDMVTNASGVASWASSDPGNGTITQVDPGPYSSVVWCSVHEEGVLGTVDPVAAPGNAIAYSIPDTQLMDCHWFNYQLVVALPGSEVKLQKWVCPPDYDAEAAANLDELWANCPLFGISFPFARVPDGGDPPVELITDPVGEILWPEFPSGTGIITETAAEMNLSRVFCTNYDIGVIGIASYSEYPAISNQISYDLASGQGLDCEWFNYPIPVDLVAVDIYKRACPEGDWSETSFNDLSLECADPMPDVAFSIGSPSYLNEGVTNNVGFVNWQVPAGDTYSIAETTPAGYGAARVFCTYYDVNVGPGLHEEVETPGNAYEILMEPDFAIECYWFNLPTQFGTMVVEKLECPEGYGTGTGLDSLTSSCQTPIGGVTFTLDPDDGDPVQADTDAVGQITFTDVPLGAGTLAELVPQAYNFVEVYCSINDGLYEQYTITATNVLTYQMEAEQTWSCFWYNLQLEAGPASLTINKYTCQEAHDPIEPNQTLANECAEPTEDITFTLASAATSLSASTGEGGSPATIQFSELEPGTYLLTEEIPETVRTAYVSECRSDVRNFSYPFYPFAVIEADGRINVDLLPGEDLECDWYNVLQETPGEVTIIKYWCQGNMVNPESCDLYGGGVGFTLVPSDGSDEIALVTGEDGTATVEAEGTYEVVEEDFEWCSAQSNAADADGNITVGSGQEVEVEIFNCGPQPIQGGS